MTAVDAAPPRPNRVVRVVTRIPATLTMMAIILVAGVIWQGLWVPFEEDPLFDVMAYGLPAFEAGRWYTPITGTFFVAQPFAYIFTLAGFVGMAYLEWRRGSLVALAYYWVGQLFAIFATALVLWLLAMTPWVWAQTEATLLDVGASGGTMACLAAAAGLLADPWRVRLWLVLLGYVFITMLFWGGLADVEHLFAVLLILFVDRSLRIQRTTLREQRLIAFVGLLVLGAMQIIVALVPTDGPLGEIPALSGGWLDVTIDAVLILLVANGVRRGRRWAWVLAILGAVINFALAGLVIATIALNGLAAVEAVLRGEVGLVFASALLWLLMLVYLIWVRRAFRARPRAGVGIPPEADSEEVRGMLRQHGGGTLSWMTTWEGNQYARMASGCLVAYQRRAGVALALADPIGPEPSRAAAVAEFAHAAETAGLVPCFFSCGDATKDAAPEGWRSIVVADDTIVDLPGLQFTGKAWGAVRTALNRAGREEMTFRLTRLRDESWGVRAQLQAISDMWVGDKGLPEMRFTLGTLAEADDPDVRIALAISPQGDVDGFLSWLPVYGDGEVRGWTLDLMRRREGGFGPVMEFLIGSSAKQFAEEGAEIMSLSGAPLTHDYPDDAGMIATLSDWLAEKLEPVYGFRSLHRFKEKFHPRYETMYLVFRDESDLARIGPALTRAFLPDATLRQFAGAGLELVRGDRD
jgi:lysylphosphatidylglycerol synthetase-like protein (DUF2156 family)